MEPLELSYTGRASRIKILPRHNPSGLPSQKEILLSSCKTCQKRVAGNTGSLRFCLPEDGSGCHDRPGVIHCHDPVTAPRCVSFLPSMQKCVSNYLWRCHDMTKDSHDSWLGNDWEVSNNPKELVEDTWFFVSLEMRFDHFVSLHGWLQRDQEEAGQGRVQAVGFSRIFAAEPKFVPFNLLCVSTLIPAGLSSPKARVDMVGYGWDASRSGFWHSTSYPVVVGEIHFLLFVCLRNYHVICLSSRSCWSSVFWCARNTTRVGLWGQHADSRYFCLASIPCEGSLVVAGC